MPFFPTRPRGGVKYGTIGELYAHKYGMTTQKELNLEMLLNQSESLGNGNLMRDEQFFKDMCINTYWQGLLSACAESKMNMQPNGDRSLLINFESEA